MPGRQDDERALGSRHWALALGRPHWNDHVSETIRDLTTLADCRAVVDVQIAVWGQDGEIVPASLLSASVKRGGILIGAHVEGTLAGFVWSMPGWREGRAMHWSHMLGVRPELRGGALGERLKTAQRERALAAGIDLIEWTFDPLQAQNAHLNMSILGCVASTYRVDAYGAMSGPLHRGTPTDRLIAEWELRVPHVARRLARRQDGDRSLPALRTVDFRDVPSACQVTREGDWFRCGEPVLDLDVPRVFVPIPPRFGQMQHDLTDLALTWRLTSRAAFTAYFARGYRVVDFLRDGTGGGSYLLARLDHFD